MLVDCENFRPLEVEAIAGSVVKLAEKHKIAAPHLNTIYALLQAFDKHRQHERKN
jgi:2-dehydropantoate 2-reductase